MARINRVGELETSEDLAFENTSNRVRKVARIVLWLFVFLALLGLFGDGPLSHARAGDESGFFVKYERFARAGGTTRVEIHFGAGESAPRRRLVVTTSLLQRGDLERFVPEPLAAEIAVDRSVFTFANVEAGGVVVLELRPSHFGQLRFSIGPEGGSALDLSLFVYP